MPTPDHATTADPPRTTGYAARIFDFDGTLADIADLNARAARSALGKHGVHVSLAWVNAEPFTTMNAFRARLHRDHQLTIAHSDHDLVLAARTYWLTHTHLIRRIATAEAVARWASTQGRIAVASANDGAVVRAGLEAAHLSDLFPVVIAREDVSHVKPAPDAFLAAADRLGVPPHQCLVYENTEEGIQAANTAGMDVIDIRDAQWQ
ncbi:HAD family phosphatase [Streptomyces sp. MS2.AVA.5]|uniref:HAD family phosphatase n=1 Tax=Streptomyces achmelvichensis TaxID=3134111 RepID=A0ACC6Q8F1_9ACTN